MAVSRYRSLNLIDQRKYIESSDFPDKATLDAISTFQIRASKFDRLDILAFKHLGAGEYWWVIAVLNGLDWSFKFEEGQILKIPVDVDEVLRLF